MSFYSFLDATGSLVENRFVLSNYTILVYLIIAVFIILGIMIWMKLLKKKHESPEYIAKQAALPTTLNHVIKLAKVLSLSKEETQLMWKICRDTKAKNILFSYSDDSYMESIFKQEYQHLRKANAPDKLLLDFFHLRFHIYKAVNFSRSITSSHNVPVGTVFSYPAPSGFQYQFTLVKNEENALFFNVPDTMDDECKDKPQKLDKLAMVFSLANSQQYAVLIRVIQFLNMPNGEKLLMVTHSNTVCPQSRRTSMRFIVNRDCSFSAVEVSNDKKGELVFKPKENVYNGTIVDLSEGGCKLFTNLPIKHKQYIYLRFDILGKTTGIYGQIANTRTDFDSGMYSLHIAFKQTSLETRANLLSDLYDWSE